MRVLGLDPGLAHIGYGLLDTDGRKPEAKAWGEITTPKSMSQQQRLAAFEQDLTELVRQLRPDVVALEKVIPKGMFVGARETVQCIGVLLLVTENCGLVAHEHAVGTWKKAIVGDGRAEKRAIQIAVQREFGLASLPRPDHAADALAIALYHATRLA